MSRRIYKGVVMGGSAGSLEVFLQILADLPATFSLPVIVAAHMHPKDSGEIAAYIDRHVALHTVEAMDKQKIEAGYIYFPASDYHLLIERHGSLALSSAEKINYSRPSIDVLFESAAFAWGSSLIGVILTGANSDGAEGFRLIKKFGGFTIAQDPKDAEYPMMVQAAIKTGMVDRVEPARNIGPLLRELSEKNLCNLKR